MPNAKDTKTKSVYERITNDHIDALQEIGNIGSGHAANALSELLNRRIDLSLPRFRLLTTTELSKVNWCEKDPGETLAEVILESTGDMELTILVIFDEATVDRLIQIMRSDSETDNLERLSSLNQSIIRETGNILALHYLTAFNTFLGVKTVPAEPPNLLIESSEAILTSIATSYMSDFSHVILIECDIFASDTKLSPLVVLIPPEKTLENLLLRLFGE